MSSEAEASDERQKLEQEVKDIENPAASSVDNPLPPIMAIDLPAPGSSIASGDHLNCLGWILSASPIAEISIAAEGKILGYAVYGLYRPDLGEAFPKYSNADHGGFSFFGKIDLPPCENLTLIVSARFLDGQQRDEAIQIKVLDAKDELPADSPGRVAGRKTPVHLRVDKSVIDSNGELRVAGWALSHTALDQVAVYAGTTFLGLAELGIPRPDIAHDWSDYPNAAMAGFSFTLKPPSLPDALKVVRVEAHASGGFMREVVVPLGYEVVENVPEDPETLIKLEIDRPQLSGGVSLDVVRSSLRVEGWALAKAGIASIRAYLDSMDPVEAHYGVRREDVAAVFPDWHGSLWSGFGMSMPLKMLSAGEHSVRVVARDQQGRERSTSFKIQTEQPDEAKPPEALRKRVGSSEKQLYRNVLAGLKWEPLFLIYMPVKASELELARATISALSGQAYDNWQLTVIVDEGTADRVGAELLMDFSALKFPVLVLPRTSHQGDQNFTGAQWDDAVTLCGILKPGDRLGPDALLELAMETGIHPDVDFVYTDERRKDPITGKEAPYLKPEWSPEFLRSSNYIGRSWMARGSLLRRAGVNPADASCPGDYEAVLRLTRLATCVAHIPKVLFQPSGHNAEDSAAEMSSLKQAAGLGGDAEILPGGASGVYRWKRKVTGVGLVSIIVPTCGARGLIRNCIESIRRLTPNRELEIIAVENIPTGDEETKDWLRKNADKVLSTSGAFNWSAFNNIGARSADPRARYLLFLNDDIEIFDPHWLNALLEHGQREDVGVTGPMLLFPDRSIQHAALHLVGGGRARHGLRFAKEDDPGPFARALMQREVVGVTGACMLIERGFFNQLGGFDETHAIINNDLDFCLRSLEAGRSNIYTPYSRLIHHEMSSRSSTNDLYNIEAFDKKWSNRFAEGDPYYSPLLSRHEDNYTIDPEPVEIVFGAHPLLTRGQITNILALKLDHIGDFITAFPAFRRLKQRFPNAKLTVLAGAASARLAALEPSIDEVIEFNFFNETSSKGRVQLSDSILADLRARLEAARFDIAIDLRKHPETRDLLKLAHAKLTAGFDSDSRFPWLDVTIEWDQDRPGFAKRNHVVHDLLRLVDAVGMASEEPARTIEDSHSLPAGANRSFDAEGKLFDKPVLCIHPASGNPLRMWPEKHFKQLIELIHAEYDVNIVLVGGDSDVKVIEWIIANLEAPASAVSMTGKIPLTQLPLFLRRCALFIGNNSGPQHIAAGVGTPTIGIHSGVVDAHEWAPVGPNAVAIRRNMTCSPCYFSTADQCFRGLACLTELQPGDVLPICRRLLAIRGGDCRRKVDYRAAPDGESDSRYDRTKPVKVSGAVSGNV